MEGSMTHLRRLAVGALLLSLAGCQESSGPLEPPEALPTPQAARIAAASPTAFALLPGEVVPTPEVTVTDAAGERLLGVPIRFTVLGGGNVTQAQGVSDAAGRVVTSWVLGNQPGLNVLLVSTGELPPVVFIAEGGYESTSASYGLVTPNHQASLAPGVAGGALHLYGNGTFSQIHVLGSSLALLSTRHIAGNYVREGTLITFSGPGSSWAGRIAGDTVVVDGPEGWDPAAYLLMSSVTECTPKTASPTGAEDATYVRLAPHRWPPGARSTYLLRANSTFALRYHLPSGSTGEYLGSYSRSDSVITLLFDAWGITGRWEATGIVRGRSLSIAYNEVAAWDDFEDGVYAKVSCTATDRRPE
jgi:hypothetical protein